MVNLNNIFNCKHIFLIKLVYSKSLSFFYINQDHLYHLAKKIFKKKIIDLYSTFYSNIFKRNNLYAYAPFPFSTRIKNF